MDGKESSDYCSLHGWRLHLARPGHSAGAEESQGGAGGGKWGKKLEAADPGKQQRCSFDRIRSRHSWSQQGAAGMEYEAGSAGGSIGAAGIEHEAGSAGGSWDGI